MGRAPCCDKANVKKGPWSPEEDAKLKAYIAQHGTGGNWISLPQKIGLKRCGKSCRLRWLNYLRPNIKHGGFSEEEDNIICSLYISIGSRWSIIAAQLPGRTDNDIKNYWNTRLKKKLLSKEKQGRQAISLNQETMIKRESDTTSMVNQLIPYWPNQEPHDLNQASITKFSDDHHQQPNTTTNFHYPFDFSSTQEQLYENTCSQLPNTPYVINGTGSNLIDMVYSSVPQQLESYSGVVDMVNGTSSGTTSSSAESTSWGNVVYPPMLSNFDACQQGMLQNFPFEESGGYFGLH